MKNQERTKYSLLSELNIKQSWYKQINKNNSKYILLTTLWALFKFTFKIVVFCLHINIHDELKKFENKNSKTIVAFI